MRTMAVAVVVMCLAGAALAGSGEQGFGIGLASGAVSGVCFKAWMSEKMAVDATVGLGYIYWRGPTADIAFAIHDFEFWPRLLKSELPGKWPFYYGAGVSAGVHYWGTHQHSAPVHIGVFAKVGTAFIPNDLPLDFFIEPALGLYLLPAPYIAGAGKVGVRLWL